VTTVLIIGASRGIGLETVKAALEAGHSVRALARSARRIAVDHPKLEKMAGDALEMATVKRALTGVDVVTQTLGVSAGPEIILKPTQFFSKATRALVTAMEEARVKRLICVTGFGAGDSRCRGGFLYSAAFHLLLGRIYDDKDVQERIVRRSKLLRCGEWMAPSFAVKSPADGYTFLVTAGFSVVIAPHLLRTSFDPFKDLEPVTQFIDAALLLAVHPSVATARAWEHLWLSV
jgi:NAD(P)-dependent dehydrogenase (short-subunit alcohol dehydrogenase family)